LANTLAGWHWLASVVIMLSQFARPDFTSA
jgi:hypothetical protein